MFGWITKRSFKFKIGAVITIVAFICIVSVSTISYFKSKEALISLSENQLISMSELMSGEIKSTIKQTDTFTKRLARNRLVEGLFLSFESAFYGAGLFPGEDLKIFNDQYDKLDKNYGERIRKVVNDFGLGNLLLVSLDGQVIMSSNVDKKGDFLGRNLLNGAYKGTTFSKCAKSAIDDKTGKVFYSRYFYNKVTKSASAFLCTKQFAEFDHLSEGIKKGEPMGVVITALDIKNINKKMSQRVGMGETGQSYLVGEDHLLRSDFFINKKDFNVKKSLETKLKVNTSSVTKALQGEKGYQLITDPNGYDVISSFQPVKVFGVNWALVTEIQESEILAPIEKMMIFVLIVSSIILLAIIFIGLFISQIMVNPIVSANNILSQVSDRLLGNSDKSKENSTSLAQGSDQIASAIQETVSTLDELTSMVNRNLENVETSSQKSKASQDVAEKGKDAISDMVSAMDDINQSNENVVTEMNVISSKINEIIGVINEIDTKTQVINDIVFQTKLLSFNASVEAARAGEHGKGFAVVAEEVGSLATASGKAADEISTLLTDSINKVESIVKETNEKIEVISGAGREKVSIGTNKANECGGILDQILDNVKGVSAMVTEITHASNEQATGIEEVTKAMNLLDEMSNNTASISGKAMKSSEELTEDSTSLLSVLQDLTKLVHGHSEQTTQNKDKTFVSKNEMSVSAESSKEKLFLVEGEKMDTEVDNVTEEKPDSMEPKKEAAAVKVDTSSQAARKAVRAESAVPDKDDHRFEDI